MEGVHHPLTHIYPNILPQPPIPGNFVPLHTAFDIARLPPIPRILDLQLSHAARNVGHAPSAFPNVMELALLGDTVLKTIIVEKLQELANCGKAGIVADLSARLNQNVTFSYLCLAYQLLDIKDGRKQKVYADVFEAYIGALWRESNDLGKAHIRMVVRAIFSPEVFPIIAEWQAGRRYFDKVGSLNAAKKTQRIGARKAKNVARAIRAIRIAHPVKVGGRSREQSFVFPRGMPPILARNGVTKAKRFPVLQIGRNVRKGRGSSGPLSTSRRERNSEVIDLTLDEDEEEDDDDIVCLDDESVEILNRRVNGISPNAEAGPSRTPELFIDVDPAPLGGTVGPVESSGVLRKRKRGDDLEYNHHITARSKPIASHSKSQRPDEIDEIFAAPCSSFPTSSPAQQSAGAVMPRLSGRSQSPSSSDRRQRTSSDMIFTPLTLHPIRISNSPIASVSHPTVISPTMLPRSAEFTDASTFSDTMQSPTVMTRARRRLDYNVQAAIAEMGLGDDNGAGPEKRLDQNIQAAIAEMGLGNGTESTLGDDAIDAGKRGLADVTGNNLGDVSDHDSDMGLGILFDHPAPPVTALHNQATVALGSPSSSDMVLTPLTVRNPLSPRSVPDWIAHLSPTPAPAPLPSASVFTALRLDTPTGPTTNPKTESVRSPLRMLGDVFGSVRSRVEAAFKKKVTKQIKDKETKTQKKARQKRFLEEAERVENRMKEEEDHVSLGSESGTGEREAVEQPVDVVDEM